MTNINIEILQNIPYANINRDDSGLPKTANIGGVSRGRISSQAMKRAARFYNNTTQIPKDYYRTKLLYSLIDKDLNQQEKDIFDTYVFPALKDNIIGNSEQKKGTKEQRLKTLALILNEEIEGIKNVVKNFDTTYSDYIGKTLNNAAQKRFVNAYTEELLNVFRNSSKKDISLWGRFFADNVENTFEGAASVAHAFTTHPINIENDFFAAMDDGQSFFKDNAGAGHPGNTFYSSGLFYKYATIRLDELFENLITKGKLKVTEYDDESEIDKIGRDFVDVVRMFFESFIMTLPTGYDHATAPNTLPDFIRITITPNSVNNANAFTKPIEKNNNYLELSYNRLENYVEKINKIYGLPEKSYYVSTYDTKNDVSPLGDNVESLSNLLDAVSENATEIFNEFKNNFLSVKEVEEVEENDENITENIGEVDNGEGSVPLVAEDSVIVETVGENITENIAEKSGLDDTNDDTYVEKDFDDDSDEVVNEF